MQAMWDAHDGINLSHKFMVALKEEVATAVTQGRALNFDAVTQIPVFHTAATQADPYSVYSNEALSIFNWLEATPEEETTLYFDALAQVVQNIAPDAFILYITRNPYDWIRSMYDQNLAAGAPLTYEEFLQKSGPGLKQHLDFNLALSGWRTHYGVDKIIMLPFELFKDNPKHFFTLLQEKTGCPIPNWQQAPKNQSTTPKGRAFMQQSFQMLDFISNSDIFDPQNKDIINQVFSLVKQSIKVDLIQNTGGKFKQDIEDSSIMPLKPHGISPELHNYIQNDYLPALHKQEKDYYGFYQTYADFKPEILSL